MSLSLKFGESTLLAQHRCLKIDLCETHSKKRSISLSSRYPIAGRRLVYRNEIGPPGELPTNAQRFIARATSSVQSARSSEDIKENERSADISLTSASSSSSDFAKAIPENSKLTLSVLVKPVAEDLETLNLNLRTVVGARHPMLMSATEQIFSAGGKRMRPALVFLVSRATAELAGLKDILPQHRRLAEITEMIHTASLMHDDVLDNSDTRRGADTVHQLYGTRVAVLAGDFLFAQSSWYLANLDNLEVIKLISQVIADFANGEIQQAASLFDTSLSFDEYMDKSYFKTASLIAAGTKCASIFSGTSPATNDFMFEYGRHLGLSFQIVDDILDFTQTSEQLGKPAGSDLKSGNLTAPVLFALRESGSEAQLLRELIEGEFVEEGSLEQAIECVVRGGGIEKSREMAKEEGRKAKECLRCLSEGELKRSLEGMVDYVLERIF